MLKPSTAREALILSSVAAGLAFLIPTISYTADLSPNQYSNVAVDLKETLRYGYMGHPVKSLQLELKKMDFYQSTVDGKFGMNTQNAVKQFQKSHGLLPDGIAGQNTIKRIKELRLINVKSLKMGDQGQDVQNVQIMLQKLNYYQGKIDGLFGQLTHEAVKSYQSQNKLRGAGIADQNTITHLKYNKNKKGKTITTFKVKQISSFSVDTSIVSIAKGFIGTPYLWGGVTPSGFDCSGFLMYIYEQKGITIPRTVSEIWNYSVDVEKVSVGDIVFFQTYKRGPSHLGIYLGNGDFIHTGSDKGVQISNLNNSYWNERYLGAKRIIQSN